MSEDKITLKIDSIDKLTEHWIAEGERIATERIIKLLKENLISAKLGVIPVGNSNWWQKGMEYAIELIKGATA